LHEHYQELGGMNCRGRRWLTGSKRRGQREWSELLVADQEDLPMLQKIEVRTFRLGDNAVYGYDHSYTMGPRLGWIDGIGPGTVSIRDPLHPSPGHRLTFYEFCRLYWNFDATPGSPV
jgi:hypothetical protein